MFETGEFAVQLIFETRQLHVGADDIGAKLSAIHTQN
jgi:hypothetical protein